MQQFYVAVGHAQSKLNTLQDLLRAIVAERSSDLRIGICCSSRDSCDQVVLGIAEAGFEVACWHADMRPDELAQTGRLFCDNNLPPRGDVALRLAADATDPDAFFVHPDDVRGAPHGVASCGASAYTLVATDAALKAVPQHAQPITAHLLVNYDLPTSREHHQRRIASIIGPSPATSGGHAQRAMIHFVVAGQMAAFRALEVFSGSSIREMPVHAADILA